MSKKKPKKKKIDKKIDYDIENQTDISQFEDDELMSSQLIIPDEDKLDIIIEITSDDNVSIDEIVDDPKDIVDPISENGIEMDEIILSKHKLQGKHALKYDSIFKGKKDEKVEDGEAVSTFFNENFEVDRSSPFYIESYDDERYLRSKKVKERVFHVLGKYTDINFNNNRRKPAKQDFNRYYQTLSDHLAKDNFSNIEIFSELSVYFSDNLFNMFKLLDNNWRNLIIEELQEHIGKRIESTEIINKNITVGAEIEFIYEDNKLITGVVIEVDYDDSVFKINSFEKIYDVPILRISKILNNSKFKYNLNRLNNIDFL